MKNFIKTRWFIFGTYLLLVLTTAMISFVLLQNNQTLKNVVKSFFEVTENRTFDYRQSIQVLHKRPLPNQDIVVLAIDDASLEMLWEKYGEWPIPRNVYANMINYIESKNPKAIVFDLMFIKSIRNEANYDKYLIETMNKHSNVYTAMNFDNQPIEVRQPINLPERLSVNVNNSSKVNIKSKNTYTNCRPLLNGLLNGKANIGIINVIRNQDGIVRNVAPLVTYKDKYYPNLSLKVGSDYLKHSGEFKIDKNGNLNVSSTEIPLTPNGEAILNWYGQSGTHTILPMYKLIYEMEKKNGIVPFDFKNKIIVIGTTATSLQDTKSVPVQDNIYPGVEIHATFINNILDNNFIKKTNSKVDIMITILVISLVGIIVMLSTSAIFAFLSTILFTIAYLFTSYYLMEFFNLWVPVILPMMSIVFAFGLSYLAKYLMKARDFEYQYKLATIDGLTELYNHRYFQDVLRKQIETSRRYNQPLSLILLDIDFFKKFNDTYGHQTGDAVLRLVAQVLKKNSRTSDYVCRYGGEEMTIILPNTTSDEAMLNAERICNAIANTPFHITPMEQTQITVSVGVATFPENAQTPQDLIEWADKGLYYAKEHGRNQVRRY